MTRSESFPMHCKPRSYRLLTAGTVLLWAVACTNSDSQPVAKVVPNVTYTPGSYCTVYTSRLQGCGILGSGRFQGCNNFEDEAEECEQACLLAAPCDDIAAIYCAAPSLRLTELDACMEACVGYTSVECADGSFVSQFARCDGDKDCADGADEKDCDVVPMVPEYACRDGEFFTEEQSCDGHADCASGVDELLCKPLFICAADTQSGLALVWSSNACNGVTDCAASEDEPEDCAVASCSSYHAPAELDAAIERDAAADVDAAIETDAARAPLDAATVNDAATR